MAPKRLGEAQSSGIAASIDRGDVGRSRPPLPLNPTPLLNRTVELETIERLLLKDDVRLVTLTGPAGVGKTRLAREVAVRVGGTYGDGAAFVDLTLTRDATLVPARIACALGLLCNDSRAALDHLAAYLQERQLLLILDNFEQVNPAAGTLAEILAAAPQLKILVTSRGPLRLRWERTLRILPLPVPEPDAVLPIAKLVEIPSVALFVERAQAQRADFVPAEQHAPLLAQVARQLDGLPLAIELAAAHMSVVPLAAIVRLLDEHQQTLQWQAQDLPGRQQSLHASIGWSYDLLPPAEQRLFRQLGVFVRSVSLDAITVVLGEEDREHVLARMMALAEKSLVLPARAGDDNPKPCFEMLETMRQYAHEQLELNGELENCSRAHAHYFVELAERADPELRGRDQLEWFRRLETEHDNVRAALHWLLEHREHEPALRLAGALGYFWWRRGYHDEGRRWLEETLTAASGCDPGLSSKARRIAGFVLIYQGALDRSKALLNEALDVANERYDRVGIMETLSFLGVGAAFSGDSSKGRREVREAMTLAEELKDDYHVALNLSTLAYLSFRAGESQEAAALFSDSLARYQAAGDLVSAMTVQFTLAWIRFQMGERDKAVQLVQDGLRKCLAFQNRWQLCLGLEATLLFASHGTDREAQARLLGARDTLVQATGVDHGTFDRLSGRGVSRLRAQLELEGYGAAYREGHFLSFPATVDLAQATLEETSGTFTHFQIEREERVAESPLSPREQEILRLVAQGLTSKQVGQKLFLSPRTVDHHLYMVFNKLGVETRAQAVAVATRDSFV